MTSWVVMGGSMALIVGGCGGGGTTPTGSTPTETAATIAIQVVDGDTREPIAGATVEPIPGSDQPASPVTSDGVGRAPIPAGMAGVCASIPTRDKECRTIVPGRTTITVPLFNPNLASPEYGGGPQRTRYIPGVQVPIPSGAPAWDYRGKALLEFPPAVARGTAVLATNRGRVIAFNSRTGAIRWQKRQTPDNNIASTPAITPTGQVIVSSMDGRLVSYGLETGQVKWDVPTAGRSPIESSPLVIGETVYVGAHNGLVYAVSTETGRTRNTFQADDDIKSSLALAGENLIVGDYSGNVYALRADDLSLVWRQRHGKRFYGGAGIAEGIAVMGDVGGGVVGINVTNGRQLWRHPTGGAIVYASPAIAGNTVFIGSYNGRFEALALKTGKVRWSVPVGGRIGGSATVVGKTVYTAVLARPGEKDRTYGLDIATGDVRWTGNDGRYSPAVAAGRTLFIVGRTNLYAYPAP